MIAPIAVHIGTIYGFSQLLREMFGDKGVGRYIMFCAREMEEPYKINYVASKNRDGDTELKKTYLSTANKNKRIEEIERSSDKKAFRKSFSNLNAESAYRNFEKKKIMGRI